MWLFFVTQYNSSLSSFVPNFRALSEAVAEKSLTEKKKDLHRQEKEENEQIKGLISNMWLFYCYTIQLITIKLCTKFQNPKSSSCLEIFDRIKKFTARQTNQQTDKQT